MLLAVPIAILAAAFPTSAGGAGETEEIEAWAYPQQAAAVRGAPSDSAATVSRLHYMTELRAPEIYRVTGRHQSPNAAEEPWLRIDVIGRPNGRVGWVPASALGRLHPIRETLVIRRSKLKAVLYRGQKKIWSAPVGIGKSKWPTPAGRFYIREGIKLKRGGGVYGSFAFGTSAYSPGLSDWPGGGVIGIHGTNEPNLIPGRISHGCVRMRDAHINRLRRMAGIGTAIEIR